MKKIYTAVDMDITEFEMEDIITASSIEMGEGGFDDGGEGELP